MENDLNKLSDRAFKCAKEHGFHDVNYSDKHLLMLVITELSEAVEADRSNKHANISGFCNHTPGVINSDMGVYIKEFGKYIKDTVEDELADAVIRLLDFAGVRKFDLSDRFITCYMVSDKNTFTENMYSIVIDITNYKYTIEELVNYSIRQVIRVAKIYHIDIFQYIELKMMYNEFRPRLHGKKY